MNNPFWQSVTECSDIFLVFSVKKIRKVCVFDKLFVSLQQKITITTAKISIFPFLCKFDMYLKITK